MVCNLDMPLARFASVVRLRSLVLAAGLGLGGCFLYTPTTADMYPTMTPEAQAVRIYYAGEELDCKEAIDLGRVQAKAGEGPLFRDPTPVNMDVALAWLRVEASKRGANAVRLISHTGNDKATVHLAIGDAFFCRAFN
jgi:hypothetical protein